ncbi:Translation initiation factor SUI1-related protein, partial [hydrothermal vent metagenome]
MCPSCSKTVSDCACRQPGTNPEGDGIVRISRENKGRKGKGVTLIRGIPLPLQKLTP